MENKKSNPLAVISGVMFAATVIYDLVYLIFDYVAYSIGNFEDFNVIYFIYYLLVIVSEIIIAVALIKRRRSVELSVGFGLWALVEIVYYIYQIIDLNCSLQERGISKNYFQYYSSPFLTAYDIVYYLSLIIIFIVTVSMVKSDTKTSKLWRLPIIICAIRFIMSIIRVALGSALGVHILFVLWWFVAIVLASLWLGNVPKPKTRKSGTENSGEAFYPLGKHVALLIFTFGVWNLIWIYRMTDFLNCDKEEEPRNPKNKLLLCLFVPFYQIFWTYKTAQRVDRLCRAKGISCELTTVCLVLAIFVPIILPILLQDKINAFVTAPEQPAVQSAPVYAQQTFEPQPVPAAPAPAPQTTAQELIDLKNLLDSGIITQEEFEAKKKQLLGL